jgi:uncharacterized iron-regulated protein
MSRLHVPHLIPGVVAVMLVLLAATACATLSVGGNPAEPPPPWQSRFGREHPLIGRIWDVRAGEFIDERTLAARLADARFVLLGERHDNPDHHRLQAWAVRALVNGGRRPAVGFEMLSTDQAEPLARHLAASPRDAAGLGEAVGWDRSGWPEWAMYRPIAEVALEAGLPIVATDLGAAGKRAVRERGVAALDPSLVDGYALARALPPEHEAALAAEIRDSHCGHAPESLVPRMMVMQRARDAHMAERLVGASGRHGAVLVAGAGHVRTDWGVPAYLDLREPDAPVISLAFVEARERHDTPAAYAEGADARTLPFDYVWFTPRVSDADPCEEFRESLEKLRERH